MSASSAVELRPACDRAEWDALVAAHPGATAFHDWAWLDFAGDLLSARFRRFVVVHEQRAVGVLPLPLRERWSLDSPGLPFPFLGPLVPADLLVPTLAALRRHQRRHGPLLARFDLGPASVGPSTVDHLRGAGIDAREDSTVVVDLTHGSKDALRRGFNRQRRRNLKRAEASGVEVRPARSGELAAVLPQVLSEAYESHGAVSPYPDDVGQRVEAFAADRPEVTCWVATVDDELAGALVMLGGHPTAIAWIGGCLRRFRDQSPNTKLHVALFESAIERGFERVDLSGWVDDAVGSFKLAFGGERQTYLVVRTSPAAPAVVAALRRAAGRPQA